MANFFKSSCLVVAALALAGLTACSHAPIQSETKTESSAEVVQTSDAEHSTILLVSLEDGSIVRQTVELGADICVKALESATTTCLTQGEPIVNNSGIVVGYEMLAETIELQGRY